MKKLRICVMLLTLLFLFAACAGGDEEGVVSPDSGANAPSQSMETVPSVNPTASLPEYPVIDGSSSTQIMHAAIQAALTDRYSLPLHSQTYEALERLVPGNENPADLILAVRYYDETLADVKSRGADLVITPIAKEGFVFLLNSDNPVDSLTQQQLKDIYSGKITNWAEVGGNDEKIMVFQRNMDSGSQTAILDFMDGVPLIGDDGVTYSASMGGMLDDIAMGGSAAIGFNIYSWTMNEWEGVAGIKTVAVDGVKPTGETIADESYPLTVNTFSYYNKGNEKGKALTDWLLTDAGQKVIAEAGYVGISGELHSGEIFDYLKDENDSLRVAAEFYEENGWDTKYAIPMGPRTDEANIKALSGGREKEITLVWEFGINADTGTSDAPQKTPPHLRFIVLTREKGGEFEVINEGEVLNSGATMENVITPGDTENHRPPEN